MSRRPDPKRIYQAQRPGTLTRLSTRTSRRHHSSDRPTGWSASFDGAPRT
jgi:hypothetical protein